jgi:hypothetical protein
MRLSSPDATRPDDLECALARLAAAVARLERAAADTGDRGDAAALRAADLDAANLEAARRLGETIGRLQAIVGEAGDG